MEKGIRLVFFDYEDENDDEDDYNETALPDTQSGQQCC